MDELYLYNSKSKKRICKISGGLQTYEQILAEAGIPIADTMVDFDGVPFILDDLCIQMVHLDFF